MTHGPPCGTRERQERLWHLPRRDLGSLPGGALGGCTRWAPQPSSARAPRGVPRGLDAAARVALPHAVGRVVANGRQHQGQLPRPVVQVERTNAGQVCAQVPVNARTFDADERAQVQAGPRGVWGRNAGSAPWPSGRTRRPAAFSDPREPRSLPGLSTAPCAHWGPRSPRRLSSPWHSGSPGWPRLRSGCLCAAAEGVGVSQTPPLSPSPEPQTLAAALRPTPDPLP